MADGTRIDPHWKPGICIDCGAAWPSWSIDGPTGPWRCRTCHTVAVPLVPPALVKPELDPSTTKQGTLL